MKLSSAILAFFCCAVSTVSQDSERKRKGLRQSLVSGTENVKRIEEVVGKEERFRASAASISILAGNTLGKRRVFIKYKDELKGDERFNIWGEAIKTYTEDNTVVAEVDEETFEKMKADDRIEALDDDNIVHGLSRNVGTYWYSANQGRLLDEQVPWGLEMIQALRVPAGKDPVKVCIVDTGYAIDHPDLPTDSVTGSNLTQAVTNKLLRWDEDLHGHGSHVAGTISAMTNNDFGVAGAGPIHLHIARGLDDSNSGYESDIVDALYKCKDAGAKVISLSLGGARTLAWKSHLAYKEIVRKHGILVIAAAGNSGTKEKLYPASHPDVVSVIAVKDSGKFWGWSNYNEQVELAAPGVLVLSTTTSSVAVHVDDFSYPAEHVNGSKKENVSGSLRDCGYGTDMCYNAEHSICLVGFGADQFNIETVVENCVIGGGIGAIAYDNFGDGRDFVHNLEAGIPVIHVSRKVGEDLVNHALASDTVTISFGGEKDVEYTFDFFTGTSMAAPHVAAAAALVWGNFPKCSNHQIRYALARTAQDQGKPGCDDDYGYGVVRAYDAYQFLLINDCGKTNFQVSPSSGGCTTYHPHEN